MPKALTFKGDKPKPKKRKRTQEQKDAAEHGSSSNQLAPSGDLAAEAEHDENWVSVDNVSDLAGPVMLVFPSEPVMALACDQLGRLREQSGEHGRGRGFERRTARCQTSLRRDTRSG